MPLYNAQDIQDQIWNREGIKTAFDFDGQRSFRMSYDQFYKEALDDEASVSQLQLRIDTYLKTQIIF